MAEEKHYQRMQKAQNAEESASHLRHLENQKKESFERKKNDNTNKIQTIAMHEEISHRSRESQVARSGTLRSTAQALDH